MSKKEKRKDAPGARHQDAAAGKGKSSFPTRTDSILPRLVLYDKGPRTSNLPICIEAWGPYLVTTFGQGADFLEGNKYKKVQMPKWSTYDKLVSKMSNESFLDKDDSSSNDSDSDSDTSSVASTEPEEDDEDGDALSAELAATVKKRRKDLVKRLYEKAVDEAVKLESIWKDARPKAYAWMISMSDEKVKEALMGDDKWERVNARRDPLKLAQLMKRRLSTEPTKIRADAQERALEAYMTCKQGGRALVTFYKDFKERVAHLEEVGVTAFETKTLALSFIKRLNQHYAPLLASIMNKQREEPGTVKAAYEMALELYVTPAVTGSGDTFTTRDATTGVSLAINAGVPGKGKGKSKTGGSGQPGGAPASGGGGGGDGGAGDKGQKKAKECWTCGEGGHISRDCPKKPERRATVLVVQSRVLSTEFAMASDGVHGMRRYEVGHDDMSSVHIVRDRELLTDLREAREPILVEGIGGQKVLNRVGDFGPFGEAWYHPEGIGNVISSGRAVDDGAEKTYDSYHDEYCLSMGDWKWHFGRRRDAKVYTTNMEDLAAYNFRVHYGEERECHGSEIAAPAIETVATKQRLYTVRELEGIERAKRLMATYGWASARALVKLVRHGKIRNCPVTAVDILNCLDLHGPELARERGHRTRVPRRAVGRERSDAEGVLVEADVALHVDLMFVERVPFVVSMATPMKYLMANYVTSKGTGKLKEAIGRQRAKYVSQGFNVNRLYCDGESAISALAPQLELEVTQVHQAGPETHVPVIEVGIQYVKRMARGIIASLAFVKIALPRLLIVWLIYFAVSRINMLPTSTLEGVVCPREYYSGRAIDAKTDLACTFLERVEVHQRSTNSMQPRTRPALALVSTGNVYGTWKCLYLDTLKVGSMDAWTPLPTDEATVRFINHLASKDRVQLDTELEFKLGEREVILEEGAPDDLADLYKAYGRRELVRTATSASDYDPTEPVARQAVEIDDGIAAHRGVEPIAATADSVVVEAGDLIETDPTAPAAGEVTSQRDSPAGAAHIELPSFASDAVPDLSRGDEYIQSEDLGDDDESVHESASLPDEDRNYPVMHEVEHGRDGSSIEEAGAGDGAGETVPTAPSTEGPTLRPRRHDWKSGPWQARVYETGLHITVRQALRQFPEPARAAMRKEVSTILRKGVTRPVAPASLSRAQRRGVIRSSMFLKEKFKSTGEFDVLKARFVAGGHMQDRTIYSEGETSSPTVATTSAYMVMAIAAHEGRKVFTMDVGGAYLNADMKRDVYMRVDPATAKIFLELDPTYSEGLDTDGTLLVKLEKALYGCIESSKLWYDVLSSELKKLGFKPNCRDLCVFNYDTPGGEQLTVAIYVDDLLCTCLDEGQLEWLAAKLTEAFKELTVHRGALHSYLGHTLDFVELPGKVKLTMEGYINDLLRLYEVRGTAATPATSNLFDVDSDALLLIPTEQDEFHSCVAKVLYLAKRVRPDLLTAVSFLATRVSVATVQDQSKLTRVLRYLNATSEMGLVHQRI